MNKKKTEISQKRASFLGHIITSEGVKADPEKVQGIAELTRPTNREEVRILQGTVNYLSKFLPRLSQVMEPIRQLTRDGVVFQWGEAQERAFENVKSLVTRAPILAYYSPNEELVLQTDASNCNVLGSPQPICSTHVSLTMYYFFTCTTLSTDLVPIGPPNLFLCNGHAGWLYKPTLPLPSQFYPI